MDSKKDVQMAKTKSSSGVDLHWFIDRGKSDVYTRFLDTEKLTVKIIVELTYT